MTATTDRFEQAVRFGVTLDGEAARLDVHPRLRSPAVQVTSASGRQIPFSLAVAMRVIEEHGGNFKSKVPVKVSCV